MSNSGAANQIQDQRAARLIQGQTKPKGQQTHCSGDRVCPSSTAQHAPAAAAQTYRAKEKRLSAPRRGRSRGPKWTPWRSRGAILRGEQVKDRKPQRRKRKPQRRGRELRPLPRPCADRDRPWARSLGACGMRGCGEKHPGAPSPRQRPPRLGFCKGIFRWWTRAVCHQQRQERLLLLADCADRSARDEAGRRSESLRASERGRRG